MRIWAYSSCMVGSERQNIRADLWISLLNFKWHSVFTSPDDSLKCVIFQCNATKTQNSHASETDILYYIYREGCTGNLWKFQHFLVTIRCVRSFDVEVSNIFLVFIFSFTLNPVQNCIQLAQGTVNDWCIVGVLCAQRWNFRQATLLIIKIKIHHHKHQQFSILINEWFAPFE